MTDDDLDRLISQRAEVYLEAHEAAAASGVRNETLRKVILFGGAMACVLFALLGLSLFTLARVTDSRTESNKRRAEECEWGEEGRLQLSQHGRRRPE